MGTSSAKINPAIIPYYLRFLHISLGSLRALHYQLSLSKRLGLLRNEDSSLIEPKIVETEKVLNGLIRSLRDG
jgi:four helix bundle protein